MPETDLQKHAIIENFLQPNVSSKIWQILTIGDTQNFIKWLSVAYLYTALLEYEKKSLGKSF